MNEVFTLKDLPPMMVLWRAGEAWEDFDPELVEVLNMPERERRLWESALKVEAERQGQTPNIIHWQGDADQEVIVGGDGIQYPPDIRMMLPGMR